MIEHEVRVYPSADLTLSTAMCGFVGGLSQPTEKWLYATNSGECPRIVVAG